MRKFFIAGAYPPQLFRFLSLIFICFVSFAISVAQTAFGQTPEQPQALGFEHYIACSDGTVQQLYNGTVTTIAGLTDVVQVETGNFHVIALKCDGTVWAWGWNGYGQLGNGTNTSNSIPVQVPGISNAVSVSAGYEHSAAVLANGTVWTWGSNSLGQLGNGLTANSWLPTQVMGITNAIAIKSYYQGNVALLQNSTLVAWGEGTAQLDGGAIGNSNVPITVNGLANVVQIDAGQNAVLARLSDGTVSGWALTAGLSIVNSNIPVLISGLTNVVDIAVGTLSAIALINNGTLKVWGDNVNGTFGVCSPASSSTPIPGPIISDIVDINAINFDMIAYLSNGTVRVWGDTYGCNPQTPTNVCTPNTQGYCRCYNGTINKPQDVVCCTTNTTFNNLPSSIVGSPTWTTGAGNNPWNVPNAATHIYLNSNLVIPANVTLTIQNLFFEFGPNGRITVMPNAKLTLNNTTLAGLQQCQSMWQGIRVLGPGQNVGRAVTGGVANYGIVSIKNNTHIEDAIIGVACMDTPMMDLANLATSIYSFSSSLYTLSSTILPAYVAVPQAKNTAGGVLVTNANTASTKPVFRNCFQGVNLSWYNNTNPTWSSTLEKQTAVSFTDFTCDRYLWYPFTNTNNISEVGLHANFYTKVPDISNCNFTNLLFGIRGFEFIAWQVIDCNFTHPNFLTKKTVGISVYNFSNSPLVDSDVTILHSTFSNHYIGIQSAGAEINIGDGYGAGANTINPNTTDHSYVGILNLGSMYHIKNNYINRASNGVAIQNNGQNPSKVRANIFDNTAYGVRSIGNNQGTQVTCNSFDHYTVALLAQDATIFGNTPSNLSNQGVCDDITKKPADNRFYTQNSLPPPFPSSIPQIIAPPADEFIYFYRNEPTYVPTASPAAILYGGLCLGSPNSCVLSSLLSDNDVVSLVEETLQDQALMAKIRDYVAVQHDTVAAFNLLAAVNSYLAKRMSLDYYIQHKNYTQAQTLLNSLPTDTPERQDFKTLYQIRLNIAQSNRSIFELSTTEEATLTNMASIARTNFGFEAQAMLYVARGREFPIELPAPPNNLPNDDAGTIQFKTAPSNQPAFDAVSNLYPNPTHSNWYANYQLPTDQSAQLNLYDINGRMLQQHTLIGSGQLSIDTKDLYPGLYYYTISIAGTIVKQHKIVFIK